MFRLQTREFFKRVRRADIWLRGDVPFIAAATWKRTVAKPPQAALPRPTQPSHPIDQRRFYKAVVGQLSDTSPA